MLRRRAMMQGKAEPPPVYFSLDWPEGSVSPTSSSASTARTFTPSKCCYIIGIQHGGAYRGNNPSYITNPSVSSSGVSFTCGGATSFGIAFILDNVEPGETYAVASTGDGNVIMMFYGSDGVFKSYANAKNRSVTIPSDAATVLLAFTGAVRDTAYSFTDISVTKA